MTDHDKAYAVARYEHAWRLREEGMIYRKIGDRLGVSYERARQMHYVFARRVRRAAMVRVDGIEAKGE